MSDDAELICTCLPGFQCENCAKRDAVPQIGRRFKTLRISCELFVELFTIGAHPPPYEVIHQAIPADAKIRNVRLGWPVMIEVLLESAEFPELNEGDEIPLLIPVMTRTP